ncbi:hypothetical protein SH668x_002582 [Planctomicrobium sp. SH668]|uniref:hypothetical protein n=1 Tax=Planctomicrobium sp. SH668 TaxID=3448126 RepID=UPI003F5B5988
MSRHHDEELLFGADSFLDVLSNMVGILIILIVVVLGMRVAKPHEPVVAATETDETLVAVAEEPELISVPTPEPAPEPEPIVVEVEEPELPLTFPPLPELVPTPEMIAKAKELRDHRLKLTDEIARLKEKEEEKKQTYLTRVQQIQALQVQMSKQAETLKYDRSQATQLETNVVELQSEVAALHQRIVDSDPDEGPVEVLKHRLPPIGRVVTGDEIHFRLHGNKVSRVPVTDLVQEVQRDIERRKEILLNRTFYQGTSRAIEGYNMEYVLQRLSLSVSDQLRSGTGTVKIGVTSWVIKPVGPLHSETAEQALQEGSVFHQSLLLAGPTATVTFWVYPDSFDIHQKLTSATRDANFWVASRPLPEGVPIAGSPQGSKSVAQ